MADVATTKKVTDLAENTDITDEDLFIAGSAGTASLRKVKWSNVWAKIMASILNKISANNLITTTAGYLLDARQGKALDDKISELNTKIFSVNPSKSFLRSSSQKASGTIEISMSGDTGYIDFYLSATKIIRISATENSLDYWILNNGQIVKGTNAANFS